MPFRSSVALAVLNVVASALMRLIVGGALFVVGLSLLIYEVEKPPTHTTHIVLFSFLALSGAGTLLGDKFLKIIKAMTDFLQSFDIFGGWSDKILGLFKKKK